MELRGEALLDSKEWRRRAWHSKGKDMRRVAKVLRRVEMSRKSQQLEWRRSEKQQAWRRKGTDTLGKPIIKL
jgi:hypothetical protein